MNKKITLLFCLTVVFMLKLQAQYDSHYGLYFGCSINNMNISQNLYYDDSQPFTSGAFDGHDTIYTTQYLSVNGASVKPNLGFVLGGFYEYEISRIVELQFNLLFNQYGYRLEGTVDEPSLTNDSITTYDFDSNTKMSNISAAVLVKFNIWKKDMSVELGIQPSYCFKAVKEIEKGTVLMQKSVVYDSQNDYNPFNVCGSIGLTWYYFDKFFLSARLNVGLLDVLKAKEPYIAPEEPNAIKFRYSDTTSKTNSLLVTLGYRFD